MDNIKLFLEVLNLVQKHLSLPTKIDQEIKCSRVPFCQIHIFYSKFASITKNITLENKALLAVDVDDYLEELKATAWLLFAILSSIISS